MRAPPRRLQPQQRVGLAREIAERALRRRRRRIQTEHASGGFGQMCHAGLSARAEPPPRSGSRRSEVQADAIGAEVCRMGFCL